MQLDKLIADLKEFKKQDYLVKEFYEEYCNLNNREDDGSFEELVDFSFTTLLKTSSDTITNTETITFNGFKLQKFKSKTKLVINEFEKLTELERNNICQHFILRLKEVLKDFYKDPEFKQYVVELNTVIEKLNDDYLNFKNKNTKNNSFKYIDGTKYNKISKIFDWLKKEKLIDMQTNPLDFERVFQNKPIEKLIQWIGTTSDLKYFIQIINNSKFEFEDNGDQKWRVAVKCFSKTKKRSFEKIDSENLRTYKVTKTTKLKMDSLIVNEFVAKHLLTEKFK
ncbi:hypothetical protein E0I26_01105 [Flavobacterium rhamnosiphilum]|uniref:Uncharacterized protein n=1 Tax=Flavobacterium rhamnosiphilum TaxID=2541724 RepID=A0A4R5FC88_9FLAO|nr:hypothetical protein [Flavobacterium rhamnosiphilum]TDE46711.1 hypothetical protein E0I26_01105 [Flavobacterium rhamnosiphilum]